MDEETEAALMAAGHNVQEMQAEIERLRAVLRVAREGYASEELTGMPVTTPWRVRTIALIDKVLKDWRATKPEEYAWKIPTIGSQLAKATRCDTLTAAIATAAPMSPKN